MRYITQDGTEKSLESIADCAAAIRSGSLTGDSLVHDAPSDRWVKASAQKDFASLLAGSSQNQPSARAASTVLQIVAWAPWIVALALAPIYAAIRGSNFGYALAAALGGALGFAVLGAVALVFVKTRSGRLILSLVLGVFLCLSQVARLVQDQADRDRLHASAHRLENAVSSSTATSNVAVTATPVSKASASNSSQTPTEVSAGLLDLTADLVKDNNRLSQQFQSALAAVQPETLLTPTTLSDETRLHAASRRVDAWSAYLDSYERDVNQLRTNFKSKIQTLNLSDPDRTAFLTSFNDSTEKADQKIQRFLRIERSMISEIRALYAFMGDRAGLVQVSNGKLMLPTSADLDAYSAHVNRFESLATQESQVESEIQKMQNEGMGKIQEAAKKAAAE